MKIFTIGFTQKSAETFFSILKQNSINCVIDIRLHPGGQLAGFSKKEDLRFFLKELLGCEYIHDVRLSPSEELFRKYRADHDWEAYETALTDLLRGRDIPGFLDRRMFEQKNCCLLCSEATPEKCHRRLIADILAEAWGDVEIVHL